MYLYPVNSNDISMRGKKTDSNWFRRQLKNVGQKLLNMSPSHTSKEGENTVNKWNKINHWVSDPMWNRGIMGATALVTQPAIDYYNHRVDDETRTVSRNRTIAKILAGSLVGMFVVRGPVYKMVEKMTKPDGKGKWSKLLLPKDFINELRKNENALKNYRSATSMLIALLLMCVTNFALDLPLTNFLTNYFNKKSGVAPRNSENNNIFVKEVNNA